MEYLFNDSFVKQVVRIKKIEFENFRNIGKGSITLPNSEYNDIMDGAPSILGLYGQNGSGKTSVILALSVLKTLLSGKNIGKEYLSCIRKGYDRCSLSFTLGIYEMIDIDNEQNKSHGYQEEVIYSFDLANSPNTILTSKVKSIPANVLFVENEIVKFRIINKDGTIDEPKQILFDTSVKNSNIKGIAFGNATKYSQLVGDDSDVKKKLLRLKKKKYINGKSFVFSQEFLNYLIPNNLSESVFQLSDVFAKIMKFHTACFDGSTLFQESLPFLNLLTDKSKPFDDDLLYTLSKYFEDSISYGDDEEDLLLAVLNLEMSVISSADELFSFINPNHEKWDSARVYFQNKNDLKLDEYEELFNNGLDQLDKYIDIFSEYFLKFKYCSIINNLIMFSQSSLHIIDTSITGLTNINSTLPLFLCGYERIDDTILLDANRFILNKKNVIPITKCIDLNMDEKTGIVEGKYEMVVKSINAINLVLTEIVPGLQLDFDDLGIETDKDNVRKHYFEILSVKKDARIPLKYESDGVRRIVSLASIFIAVYNEPSFTVAIDEIDSGIFEYLLGELFLVLAENAQGQFIFTSHNLRPLEFLPAKYLCFTSTNPDNRFIKLRSRRGNCNLRDTYFRTIILGSNEETVYQPTDRYRMQRAFYNAGHLGDK